MWTARWCIDAVHLRLYHLMQSLHNVWKCYYAVMPVGIHIHASWIKLPTYLASDLTSATMKNVMNNTRSYFVFLNHFYCYSYMQALYMSLLCYQGLAKPPLNLIDSSYFRDQSSPAQIGFQTAGPLCVVHMIHKCQVKQPRMRFQRWLVYFAIGMRIDVTVVFREQLPHVTRITLIYANISFRV